jgi:hypothetical protein
VKFHKRAVWKTSPLFDDVIGCKEVYRALLKRKHKIVHFSTIKSFNPKSTNYSILVEHEDQKYKITIK